MAMACAPITLAASGVLSIAGAAPTILVSDIVYLPPCVTASAVAHRAIIVTGGASTDFPDAIEPLPNPSDFRTPFYATTFPQCYALAATTVLAYMLFIMLVVAPRSFLDGGIVTLGRRGFTNGHSSGVTIGGRPWLQKVAALSVAVSLTIATADTFRVAEEQYLEGYQDAHKLQQRVLGGMQLKIIQLISDTFLWLAQAQTLIRLFPRQREKIIIKWTAFALITLDVVFGALNSFHYMNSTHIKPHQFTEPIPALSYLFQLSLGLLYAAWVIYYALMKKRYAFYHPLMKNIAIMATLSIGSLLVPVVFFVLDIAEPTFTGWGDYVRWVGAAAASVVVWEWVERIEALEREEKKDGVLGREVFDGDEMIDMSPSDLTWPRRKKNVKSSDDSDEGDNGAISSSGYLENGWPAMSSISRRYRARLNSSTSPPQLVTGTQAPTAGREMTRFLQPPLWPSRPPPAITPVSRTDTASADSTIYQVRYQPLTETTSRTTEDRYRPLSAGGTVISSQVEPVVESGDLPTLKLSTQLNTTTELAEKPEPKTKPWRSWGALNPFRHKCRDPPAEVLPHTMPRSDAPQRDQEGHPRWDIRGRIEDFTATQAERVFHRVRPTPNTHSLPVTVIPAPLRPGAALAQLLEEEGVAAGATPPCDPPIEGSASPSTVSRVRASVSPRRSQSYSGVAPPVRSPLVRSFESSIADRRHSGSSSDAIRTGDQRHILHTEQRVEDNITQDQSQPGHPT